MATYSAVATEHDLQLHASEKLLSVCKRPETWACVAYAVLVCLAGLHHEPWADEAQAWLLARDSDLKGLWTHYVRLEGSPGLWHSLLHGLILSGLPYRFFPLIAGMLGTFAACVLVFCAPFPLPIRLLLPFTYFLCYQYGVVARSYSLAPLLLFSIAAVYRSAAQRTWVAAGLCLALAAVSVHGFLVSLSMALTFAFQRRHHLPGSLKRAVWPVAFYLLGLAVITVAVWPHRDAVFVVAPNWLLSNAIGMSRYAFEQAFGPGYLPAIVMGLSVIALWGTPGLLFLGLSTLSLCIFGASVYSNVWHHGFLVLSWIVALWMSCESSRKRWPAVLALTIFIAVQCSWTWQAIRYDWEQPYSGSKAAAEYLEGNGITGSRVVGIGFPTVAIQPYFGRNIFQNYSGDHGQDAFWVWSKESAANDASERLRSEGVDWVVLGYTGDSDRRLWSHLIQASGFQRVRTFAGSTFWRTGVFQTESYDLFERGQSTRDAELQTQIDFGGAVQFPDQQLWGISPDAKRGGAWAGTSFSVELQRPSGSGSATLDVNFYVPADAIRNGCLMFNAYVSGKPLGQERVCHTGDYAYRRAVDKDDLFWAVVPVAGAFHETGLVLVEPPQDHLVQMYSIGLTSR